MAVTTTPTDTPDAGLPDRRRPAVDTRMAALSGVVAAGVALGVGELVSGMGGAGPSLVTAVGTQFIDRYAASLKDLAVSLFGTNDKVALIVGIVIVSLLLGAVLGRAASRRLWVGVVGLAAFGLVGLLSHLDDPQGETGIGVAASVLAVGAGVATLVGLLRLASRTRPANRRRPTTVPRRGRAGGRSSSRPAY